MPWDLTVTLENEPGRLADLGDALGTAGVNLAGACAVTAGDSGTIHLLVDGDTDQAARALSDAGISVEERREVLVADVVDQPGTLGSYARKLADAGVNIELMYVATGTRLVFGVDDLEAARQAIDA